jgi:hypothetical protein
MEQWTEETNGTHEGLWAGLKIVVNASRNVGRSLNVNAIFMKFMQCHVMYRGRYTFCPGGLSVTCTRCARWPLDGLLYEVSRYVMHVYLCAEGASHRSLGAWLLSVADHVGPAV